MANFKDSIAGVNLIPSGGGVYEVVVDGQLIFSKKELERFPEEEELVKIIAERGLMTKES